MVIGYILNDLKLAKSSSVNINLSFFIPSFHKLLKIKELQTTRRRPLYGYKSPHVRKSNTVLDSRFQVLGYSLCQWNFTLNEIRNPRAVFWILKPRIPDSTSKNFPGFRIPPA